MKASINKGYQPGSTRNLKSYINRYLDFCIEFELHPLPAKGQTVRRFAQYLADQPTISAIDTVNNYMWGLCTFHKILGLPVPDTSEFITKLMLRGLKLQLARPIKQAQPITPQILYKMFEHIDITSDEQITAWTAMLYGFHMLLRKSNLVPDTQGSFDPQKQIARERICLATNAILVEVVWCKNMQFKEKILPFPLVALKDKVICPVYWTWVLIKCISARPSDPAFCYLRKGKFMIMTYPRLTYWLKKWLHEAGVPNKGFSMHSLRCGGVTYLHKAEIPAQVIKLLGNWASDAYLRYIDVTLGKRVQAACEFAKLLNDEPL